MPCGIADRKAARQSRHARSHAMHRRCHSSGRRPERPHRSASSLRPRRRTSRGLALLWHTTPSTARRARPRAPLCGQLIFWQELDRWIVRIDLRVVEDPTTGTCQLQVNPSIRTWGHDRGLKDVTTPQNCASTCSIDVGTDAHTKPCCADAVESTASCRKLRCQRITGCASYYSLARSQWCQCHAIMQCAWRRWCVVHSCWGRSDS
mmetsp:Transcript_5098/g.8375  ORF Transcript_5098/g.8375 Transcript_5098/m.8375 type:complete len:206 (+) Transcript_5098:536-1153(+)